MAFVESCKNLVSALFDEAAGIIRRKIGKNWHYSTKAIKNGGHSALFDEPAGNVRRTNRHYSTKEFKQYITYVRVKRGFRV